MADDDPYRDPKEGERIHAERAREEAEERARFEASLRGSQVAPLNVLSIAAGLSLIGGLVVYQLKAPEPVVAKRTVASELQAARLPFMECAQLGVDYHVMLDKARACEKDADCMSEKRGEIFTGLDGCARFATSSKDLLAADIRADKWKAGGCAGTYRICGAPPAAICEAHACVEKPPEGLPRTWHRLEVPGLYSFFAPPDVMDIGLGDLVPEDSWVTRFAGKTVNLDFDVSHSYGPAVDADADIPESESGSEAKLLHTEQLSLGGARARIDVHQWPDLRALTPFTVSVWAPAVPCQTELVSSFYCSKTAAVGIIGRCKTKADCDEILRVIHTMQAW